MVGRENYKHEAPILHKRAYINHVGDIGCVKCFFPYSLAGPSDTRKRVMRRD